MKHLHLLLAALIVLASVSVASAGVAKIQVFDNFSGANGSIRYSSAVSATYGYGESFKYRTVTFGGITAAGVFQNMSGHTVTVQCAPTDSGPWGTCSAGTAATWAASANRGLQGNSLSWIGTSYYMRVAFTRASSALNRISAWLSISN